MRCAFLRGVNVNGRKVVMSEVCDIFRTAGMGNVSAVLATGNIIFDPPSDDDGLHDLLEDALSAHYSEPFHLFVRTSEDLERMVGHDPFDPGADFHVYVVISDPRAGEELEKIFSGIDPAPGERGVIRDGVFYWRVAKGCTLSSGFSGILGRKDMRNRITSRNINTIKKIMSQMS